MTSCPAIRDKGKQCPCPGNVHSHKPTKMNVKEKPKGFFKNIFPLENQIDKLDNNFLKEFSTTFSYLTTAVLTSGITSLILKPFSLEENTKAYLIAPTSISTMYLTNKGTKEPHKPVLVSLLSIGANFMNGKGINKYLTRPLVGLGVFLSESISFHDHNHKHEHTHQHELKLKDKFISLLKLETLINTVPYSVDYGVEKACQYLGGGFVGDIFAHGAVKIIGLTTGFTVIGELINKALAQFKFTKTNDSSQATRAVCACCGAPICVAEISASLAAS